MPDEFAPAKKITLASAKVIFFVEFRLVLILNRIADGYYFAKSAKMLQYLLSNPELLEKPASEEIDMEELR